MHSMIRTRFIHETQVSSAYQTLKLTSTVSFTCFIHSGTRCDLSFIDTQHIHCHCVRNTQLTISTILMPIWHGRTIYIHINCSHLDLLGYVWTRCDQCRCTSDGTDLTADLHLHLLHTHENAYISRKELKKKHNLLCQSEVIS